MVRQHVEVDGNELRAFVGAREHVGSARPFVVRAKYGGHVKHSSVHADPQQHEPPDGPAPSDGPVHWRPRLGGIGVVAVLVAATRHARVPGG